MLVDFLVCCVGLFFCGWTLSFLMMGRLIKLILGYGQCSLALRPQQKVVSMKLWARLGQKRDESGLGPNQDFDEEFLDRCFLLLKLSSRLASIFSHYISGGTGYILLCLLVMYNKRKDIIQLHSCNQSSKAVSDDGSQPDACSPYTEFLHYLSALLQLVWYHISIGVLVLTDIRVVVACST